MKAGLHDARKGCRGCVFTCGQISHLERSSSLERSSLWILVIRSNKYALVLAAIASCPEFLPAAQDRAQRPAADRREMRLYRP